METLTVLIIAVALAMDCFAVSLAAGTVTKERRIFTSAVMGIFFGIFQMIMAIVRMGGGYLDCIDDRIHRPLDCFYYPRYHWGKNDV